MLWLFDELDRGGMLLLYTASTVWWLWSKLRIHQEQNCAPILCGYLRLQMRNGIRRYRGGICKITEGFYRPAPNDPCTKIFFWKYKAIIFMTTTFINKQYIWPDTRTVSCQQLPVRSYVWKSTRLLEWWKSCYRSDARLCMLHRVDRIFRIRNRYLWFVML